MKSAHVSPPPRQAVPREEELSGESTGKTTLVNNFAPIMLEPAVQRGREPDSFLRDWIDSCLVQHEVYPRLEHFLLLEVLSQHSARLRRRPVGNHIPEMRIL